MHSVTLSPVNSKCTPPRCAPQSLRMRQDSSSSWRILSKRRVLIPLLVVSVFPCIGSQHQSTCLPARRSVSAIGRSEEHTSELQSQSNLVCRLLLEKKKL